MNFKKKYMLNKTQKTILAILATNPSVLLPDNKHAKDLVAKRMLKTDDDRTYVLTDKGRVWLNKYTYKEIELML